MKNDLISVIIPVYNRELYLKDCLDSVCGNTYENLEIIVVNDGSTDKSADILDEYAKKDKRILVFSKENGGVSDARNAGLRLARGEWIGFIDSDDWVSPNYFQRMMDHVEKNIDVVVCDSAVVSERSLYNEDVETYNTDLITEQNAITFFLNRNHRVVRNTLYKTSTIKNIFFDTRVHYSEDELFNYSIITEKGDNLHIVYVQSPLYYYWKNPSGACGVLKDPNWRSSFIDGLVSLLEAGGGNLSVNRGISLRCIQQVLLYRYETMFNKNELRDLNIKKYKKICIENMHNLSLREKIQYIPLLQCPLLFRFLKFLAPTH